MLETPDDDRPRLVDADWLDENGDSDRAEFIPHGVDKMQRAGLAAAPSRLVWPPRVVDAPAALECKLLLVLPLKDLEGRLTGSTFVLGQVVGVHIDPGFLKGGLFDIAAAGTITRCGYRGDYAEVTSVLDTSSTSSGGSTATPPTPVTTSPSCLG